MFARVPTLFLLVICLLSVFSAASAVPRTDPTVSQCNTGPVQCCQTLHKSQEIYNVKPTFKLYTFTERSLESFLYSQILCSVVFWVSWVSSSRSTLGVSHKTLSWDTRLMTLLLNIQLIAAPSPSSVPPATLGKHAIMLKSSGNVENELQHLTNSLLFQQPIRKSLDSHRADKEYLHGEW
jgi:hypothetical protein